MTKLDNLPPTLFVIFGAGGDLTWRKLAPALYNLQRDGWIAEKFNIIGVDRKEMSDEAFVKHVRQGIDQFSRQPVKREATWNKFASQVHYLQADFSTATLYQTLSQQIADHAKSWGATPNVVFYLAIPPSLIQMIVDGMGAAGLAEDRQHHRIVVEKPFGHDLASAQQLNQTLSKVFYESQIYRIDHYLGKETVQNILAFRFGNAIFEPLWNRTWIESIEIDVAETVGVEQRGGYYDHAGALRDMIQNHLLQILCLVTMEPPIAFLADEIRGKKVDLLRSIRPLTPKTALTPKTPLALKTMTQSVLRGQYKGYRQEPNVAADSTTETFVALTLFVDNWRWQDVPITLRTGKNLAAKQTIVNVRFRQVPHRSFPKSAVSVWQPNEVKIHIQPDEGITISMMAKEPGPEFRLKPITMSFRYDEVFKNEALPEAYETLLQDVMQGDQTLFMRVDQVETAWKVVMPILDAWQKSADDLQLYEPGSWGPAAGGMKN